MIVSAHFRSFVRQNRLVVGIFACAAIAILWFATRMVGEFMYFNDPRNQDVALREWMTPKYVVMTYDLPRPMVADLLGLTSPDQRGMSMGEIAAQKGMTLDELTIMVRDAAAEYRGGQGS